MNHELLTPIEAATYLRFEHADGTPNLHAFHQFLSRHPELPRCRRGARLLFDIHDVQAWVRNNAMTEPATRVLALVERRRRG